MYKGRKKRKLSRFQIICIILLWAALCFIIFSSGESINGPTILSIIIASLLIWIPIYKNTKNKEDQ
ncbi:MAG: hypothetical protein GX905_00235 [Bacteroidales bacterium]|nr:hypothetical protein [Bacteroidales bacterium]